MKPAAASPQLHGIIACEFRAALSAMLALAFLPALVLFLRWLQPAVTGGMSYTPRLFEHASLWSWCGIIAALGLGVLAGAAEEENGTADFARRLPLPRTRIFFEKLAGCVVALLFWAVAAIALLVGACMLLDRLPSVPDWEQFMPYTRGTLPWCGLLFSAGWLASAVLRKVLSGAVLAGAIALVCMLLLNLGTSHRWATDRQKIFQLPEHSGPVWICIALLLAAAAMVSIRREGR